MKFKILVITLSILVLIVTSSYSQSEYVSKGQNGIGMFLNYQSNDQINGWLVSFGTSIQSTFDLGFSYGNGNSKLFSSSIDIFNVFTAYHSPRFETTPIRIALQIGYTTNESEYYSGDNHVIQFVPYITHPFNLSKVLLFTGFGVIDLFYPNRKQMVSFTGGMSFFHNVDYKTYIISGAFANFDNLTTISIGVGFMFSGKETDDTNKDNKKKRKSYYNR